MTIRGLASGTEVEEGDQRYPHKKESMAAFAMQSDMIHRTPYSCRIFIRQAASARESHNGTLRIFCSTATSSSDAEFLTPQLHVLDMNGFNLALCSRVSVNVSGRVSKCIRSCEQSDG